jgi:hypothetical protein
MKIINPDLLRAIAMIWQYDQIYIFGLAISICFYQNSLPIYRLFFSFFSCPDLTNQFFSFSINLHFKKPKKT